MRFTDQVAWDAADFAIAGAMLFGACGIWELTARMTGNTAYRSAAGVAIVAGVVLVWLNLAVGLIGSEDHPANLMYGGVLAVGGIGTVVARCKPGGMARALLATALAQALVGGIALVAGSGSNDIVPLTGLFAAMWLSSAWLFRKAAREQALAAAP
jgi:hypothetical protein